MRIVLAPSPVSVRARVTLEIFSVLPAALLQAEHLRIVPLNCPQTAPALLSVPVLGIDQSQGNAPRGPSNARTGASARRGATTNGSNASTTATTLGTSAAIIGNRHAMISNRIAISAGTISRTHRMTGRTGAMRTVRTGKITARICGTIVATAPRKSGTTPVTSTMIVLTIAGGVTADGVEPTSELATTRQTHGGGGLPQLGAQSPGLWTRLHLIQSISTTA